MLLDDLVACIESLQKRIRSHGASLRGHETRTRMALIDPLLQALGWDVSDPGVVTPEYPVSGLKADYALLGSDGKAAAIVEAKHLGEALGGSSRMQMLTYASASGIGYAGLTDGDRWEMYTVFQQAQLEERRILDISIASAPAHELALKLLLLWRPNLASDGPPVQASTPVLGDVPRPEAKPAAVEATPAPGPPEPGWVALSEYDRPAGTPCPAAIRFWDGSERPLRYWNEIVTFVAEKLYADGRFSVADMPIAGGGSRSSVHTKPEHPTEKQFESYKRIEGTPPLYVDTWLDAKGCRRSAIRLLQRCGVDPASVHLKVAQ